MPLQELVTLNRTLAVKVGDKVEKVSAFTGTWSQFHRNDEVEYVIYAIHLPLAIEAEHITSVSSSRPKLTFKKSAIVSTQEVA